MEKLKNTGPQAAPTYMQAFDSIAESYDDTFERSEVTKRLRNIVYSYSVPFLNKNSKILDINCGTGTDALYFASLGHTITALDISPRMIAQAARKLEGYPGVELQTDSFENMHSLPEDSYDIILSNFGGLNCTPDLRPVLLRCNELLHPDGRLILVVMPSVSIWEIISGSSRLQFRRAFRRMRKNPSVHINNSQVPVYYHSLRSIRSASCNLFEIETARGLNVLSPPPYSRRFASKHPYVSEALHRLDNMAGKIPMIRTMGDHLLVVLRKKKTNVT